MDYRLIRHTITGDVLVIGSDGYVSPPLAEADYLTADAELRAGWWRVDRPEYNTALWSHPLWRTLARHIEPGPPGRRTGSRATDPHFLAAMHQREAVGVALEGRDRARARRPGRHRGVGGMLASAAPLRSVCRLPMATFVDGAVDHRYPYVDVHSLG